MAYVLSQFNQSFVSDEDTGSDSNKIYMTLQTGGSAARRSTGSDIGVTGSTSITFYDECVKITDGLIQGSYYYFHTKIKRLNSDQTFYVYLVNYDDLDTTDAKTQYLKTITVQSGSTDTWVDFDIVFTPLINFDCILFTLQRTIADYNESTVRYPVFCYEELSKINNMISTQIKNGVSLIKIGVQAYPGMLMCINGEEIHVGRSGIYEMRNGIITIDSFAVINAASENIAGTNPLTLSDGTACSLDDYLLSLSALTDITSATSTNSQCIFNNSKLRSIRAFVLDYMYKEV